MAPIISRPPGEAGRDRYWWVAGVVALPVLAVAAAVDAIMVFMLLWAVSDGCDPNGPASDQAWRGGILAIGIALGLVATGVLVTFLLPHRRQWRTARYLMAVLTVLASLWPTFWAVLAYSGGISFAGCH